MSRLTETLPRIDWGNWNKRGEINYLGGAMSACLFIFKVKKGCSLKGETSKSSVCVHCILRWHIFFLVGGQDDWARQAKTAAERDSRKKANEYKDLYP